MSKDRQAGFTPVFDDVVTKVIRVSYKDKDSEDKKARKWQDEPVGSVGALVFGIIWRHAQMQHKNCHCAIDTMSEMTGLRPSTVRKHIRRLLDGKMIKRTKTANIYEPPHYVCTYTPEVCAEPESEDVTEIAARFGEGAI